MASRRSEARADSVRPPLRVAERGGQCNAARRRERMLPRARSLRDLGQVLRERAVGAVHEPFHLLRRGRASGSLHEAAPALEELADRWNPMIGHQPKRDLVNDVNALARDFLRPIRRSLVGGFTATRPPTESSIGKSLVELP